MGPENIQNHQGENQENIGWESLQNVEMTTSRGAVIEKVKNNFNVRKAFAAVGLAASLAAGIAGFNSNREPATQNVATEAADTNYDEMLGQIQNIKDNFSNVADRISAQRERDAKMYASEDVSEKPMPTQNLTPPQELETSFGPSQETLEWSREVEEGVNAHNEEIAQSSHHEEENNNNSEQNFSAHDEWEDGPVGSGDF